MPDLCQKAQLSQQIVLRMIALEKEVTDWTKAIEAHREEVARKTAAFELERVQLAQELNALHGSKTKTRKISAKPITIRMATRGGKHWTPEEKKNLENCIWQLINGSPGFTAGAIATKLRIHRQICVSTLRSMLAHGTLRRVKVAVTFGHGMVRKMSGYARALSVVTNQEKAA